MSAAFDLGTDVAPPPDTCIELPGRPTFGPKQFSNSTSMEAGVLLPGRKISPSVPNYRAPNDLSRADRRKRQWLYQEMEGLDWYPATMRNLVPFSATTKPKMLPGVATSLDDQRWNTVFALFILAVGVRALIAKEADEALASARKSAHANEIRAAYEKAFHGLDIMLRSANWESVGKHLEEMASDQYPVSFGIGAARFASDAAARIPNWNLIIQKLIETAKKQKVDVKRAMRGLLETHGFP